MSIPLTTAQKEAQATFKQFVDAEVIPHAEQFDLDQHLSQEMIASLAEQGYFGALLPEEHGGLGMDMLTYGLLNEELGRGCASVRGLVMLQNMVGQAIYKWGSATQKELWLRKIASGNVLTSLAISEPSAGSDAKNVEMTATATDDGYTLNGQKHWITFGQISNLFLVMAQKDGHLCTFLVEGDRPGFSREPMKDNLGLRATTPAKLRFEDCRIPRENMVAGPGFGLVPVVISALNLGRYSIAWGCVGMIRACLEAAVAHTSQREQFGVLIKEHQLVQHMIADMITNERAARMLCQKAAASWGQSSNESVMDALVAKYFASTAAVKAASDAVQLHGAAGCHSGNPVQRHLRDAKIMEIIEGTTQIHQIKIAEYGYKLYG